MKRRYERGDRVWWWSEQVGQHERGLAIFVRDDGKNDVILAVKLNHFRWPRKLTAPESALARPPKIFTGLPKRKPKSKRRKKPRFGIG